LQANPFPLVNRAAAITGLIGRPFGTFRPGGCQAHPGGTGAAAAVGNPGADGESSKKQPNGFGLFPHRAHEAEALASKCLDQTLLGAQVSDPFVAFRLATDWCGLSI
jgi:hypothetical protein